MYKKITYVTKIEDAPNITPADLLALSEAADLLGVSIQTVDYYIRAGDLAAVINADDDERTSYRRTRRWLIRDEVERLKITLIDNAMKGKEWRVLDNGDLIMLLPEAAEAGAVKGNGSKPIRRITLNQADTGDLEIDIIATRDGDKCAIRVDIQSERLYPNMQGINVLLHLPNGHRTATTNKQGGASFDSVPCDLLHLARIEIKSDPRQE